MLERLMTAEVFALMLIFARIGSALILMPGIGENYVSPRVRLLLAGAIAIVVAPVVAPRLPALPASVSSLFLLLGGEIGIGLFIGTVARLALSSLETAGTLIAFQTGLASAQVFNPLLSDQGSLVSVLISVVGLVLIFETDMLHLLLRATVDSYTLFVPGALPPIGDFSEMISRLVARSFAIAMQLSAPFLVLSLVTYIALALITRLMPQLQIFFVALPLQIGLGFLLLSLTFSTLMMWFLENFADVIRGFLAPP
ncbi:MAG TPA: flagellar biosynthetic protein FliR [Candidatus Sulfotelmatobacter sp.]|nr:flagellar biosynthetic protein FliR [Candidatus Sulfotelmatobacter sp.]